MRSGREVSRLVPHKQIPAEFHVKRLFTERRALRSCSSARNSKGQLCKRDIFKQLRSYICFMDTRISPVQFVPHRNAATPSSPSLFALPDPTCRAVSQIKDINGFRFKPDLTLCTEQVRGSRSCACTGDICTFQTAWRFLLLHNPRVSLSRAKRVKRINALLFEPASLSSVRLLVDPDSIRPIWAPARSV
jgi:hypothetical protein